MAYTLSRYLKLRLDSGLTANSRYNLERLDLLGSTLTTDTREITTLRSRTDIVIEPNALSSGGSGSAGNVSVGTSSHTIGTLTIYASSVVLSTPLSIASGGTGANTAADAINALVPDQSGNAGKVLQTDGSAVSWAESLTTNGAQTLTNKTIDADANTILNLVDANLRADAAVSRSKLAVGTASHVVVNDGSGALSSEAQLATSRGGTGVGGSAVYPTSGTVVTRTATETLTGKSIDAGSNTITGLTNASLDAAAAVARSKLASGTASHVVINDGSGAFSSEAQLDRTRGGTGIFSTATFPSSGVVVTEAASETLTNKTIDAASNTLSNISDSSIASAASISLSKLAALTASRATVTNVSGQLSASSVTSTELDYLSGVTSAIQTQFTGKISSTEKASANGVATLDAGGKIPTSQLPSSVMEYKGAWNASTNSPTLVDGTGDNGDTYRVSVAGTQNLGSGSVTYNLGDWVIYNGTIWQRAPASDLSAFALTGLSNLTVSSLAVGSLLVGSSSSAVSNLAIGTTGQLLTVSGGTAAWSTTTFATTWVTADGVSKNIPHSLGTKDVSVTIYDLTNSEEILIEQVVHTGVNNCTLTASDAPPVAGWRVVVTSK